MDPIVIVPVALAVAWAATRKKKTTKKTELPAVTDDTPKPLPEPPTEDEPVGPYDGPGGGEPWRPGGPVGPKTFPGPKGGPKAPEEEDPGAVEIYPGTTAEEIEQFDNAAYGLFISSDCETVYEGERWYTDVFLPKARELVLGAPAAFHHPVAVIYEILVVWPSEAEALEQASVPQRDYDPTTPTEQCIAAWHEFVYGDFTPLGTYSGWISERTDPNDEYWDYGQWFGTEYPMLVDFLTGLYSMLWDEPEFAEIFSRDWPDDEPPGDLDFNPAAQ